MITFCRRHFIESTRPLTARVRPLAALGDARGARGAYEERMHTTLKTVIAFAFGAIVWLPNLHRFYVPDAKTREHVAHALAARATYDPSYDDDGLDRTNPEWEFMRRTFTVLGLANRALDHEDERAASLVAIDRIVDESRRASSDVYRFLLPYARASSFVDPEARSVFVDGELLMMIAARDLVAPRADLDDEARELEDAIERAMRRSPTMSAESYPNECWTFCNTTALAAMTMFDRARPSHGGDHRALAKDWVLRAKAVLLDEKTGLLVSSFTRDGRVKDGPEGSTIFMSATNLLFVDDAFARDQWTRARRELGATLLGFGWAREWLRSSSNARPDVDSGPIIPLLDASAGASGFAVLGASAFGDDAYRDALVASLDFAAMPKDDTTGRRYLASNRVGDAVLFDALTFGPLLRRVTR
jgi:hypothetical protein